MRTASSSSLPVRDPNVGRRLGRYDVLHPVASGGMGRVYIGRACGMAGFERLVAIKVLHPHLAYESSFVAMFLDEARLAARIRHPNVVATLDVSQSDDGYFLVMEYIEGDNLGGLLAKAARANEALPIPVILRIVIDALTGLDAAHEQTGSLGEPLNLVHRDVSPQNILVGLDGIARLTDFGVAKAEFRLSSTRGGEFKGKLCYTSPEQASQEPVDRRSDVFAMGIVLWEALVGQRLFQADTNAATLRKVLDDEIPMPSSVKPELAPFDAILKRALARSTAERYATAHEMASDLEALAPVVGGIASSRKVAEFVLRLASDKLARESAAVGALAVSGVQIRADEVPDGPSRDDEPTVSVKLTTRTGKRRARLRRVGAVAFVVVSVLSAVSFRMVTAWSDRKPTVASHAQPSLSTRVLSATAPKSVEVGAEPLETRNAVPAATPLPAVRETSLSGRGRTSLERRDDHGKTRRVVRKTQARPQEPDVLENPYRR